MQTEALPTAEQPGGDHHVPVIRRIVDAVQALSLARGLPDIQRVVRTAARQLAGCDGATFVLRENGMCHYADEDAIEPLWKGRRFPMTSSISGWTMLNREPAVIADVYNDDRVHHAKFRPTFVNSLVMVPIRQSDPVGAIGAYWATRRQPSEQDVLVLQALADSTSIAMEHALMKNELEQRVRDRTAALEEANDEIRRLSLTDELTGLYNRRGFNVLAEAALRAAREHGRHGLLAFLDVDGLKRVNDRAGHDVGDDLIVDMARVIRSTLATSDIVARIGGDEFCALIAETDDDEAGLRARLFHAFRSFNSGSPRPYALSASVGVVPVAADGTQTLEQLIAAADAEMYADKRTKLAG